MSTVSKTLQVGPWVVFPELHQIVRGDETVKLEPRVMRVLVYLARHPYEVVSRERRLRFRGSNGKRHAKGSRSFTSPF
jgi:DNA-binding winged helix-turn-helix (wHTH) protein